MNRNKKWFDGLKFSEHLVNQEGALEGQLSISQLATDFESTFDRGMLDYLHTSAFKQKLTEEIDRGRDQAIRNIQEGVGKVTIVS